MSTSSSDPPPPLQTQSLLFDLLSSTKLGDIKKYFLHGSQVIIVNGGDSLNEAFEKLVSFNIHCMPVFDPAKRQFFALLDIRDFGAYLFRLLGGTLGPNFQWNCRDLYSLAEHRPFRSVDSSCSVLDVILQSVWDGAHSIPLTEKQDYSRVAGMLSQSSLLRWLVDLDPARLGPEVRLPLKEIKIGRVGNPSSVLTVQTDNPLFKVIEVLVNANVTGCAVLDSEGHLVGNISTSDLAQMREEENRHYLNHPVQTYLSLFELAQPVTCVLEDTLMEIMNKVCFHRIHRIYCITPQRTLYSVITLSDILNALTVIATKSAPTTRMS